MEPNDEENDWPGAAWTEPGDHDLHHAVYPVSNTSTPPAQGTQGAHEPHRAGRRRFLFRVSALD